MNNLWDHKKKNVLIMYGRMIAWRPKVIIIQPCIEMIKEMLRIVMLLWCVEIHYCMQHLYHVPNWKCLYNLIKYLYVIRPSAAIIMVIIVTTAKLSTYTDCERTITIMFITCTIYNQQLSQTFLLSAKFQLMNT